MLPLSVAVATTSYNSFVGWRGLYQQMLPRHSCRTSRLPIDWIIAMHGISDGLMHRLQSVQNAAAHLITWTPRSHLADPATASLAAHPSSSDIQDCCPGLSVFNRPGTGVSGWQLPANLRRSHAPTSIVRHSNNTFGDRCFVSAGPHLRQCDSLGQFKRLLKTHLFSSLDRGALWHFCYERRV